MLSFIALIGRSGEGPTRLRPNDKREAAPSAAGPGFGDKGPCRAEVPEKATCSAGDLRSEVRSCQQLVIDEGADSGNEEAAQIVQKSILKESGTGAEERLQSQTDKELQVVGLPEFQSSCPTEAEDWAELSGGENVGVAKMQETQESGQNATSWGRKRKRSDKLQIVRCGKLRIKSNQ